MTEKKLEKRKFKSMSQVEKVYFPRIYKSKIEGKERSPMAKKIGKELERHASS